MKIGLLGFGKMGQSVFKLLVGTPHAITVVFRTPEKAATEREGFFKKLARSVKRKTLTSDEFAVKQKLLCFTHAYEELADVDIILENLTEDFNIKRDAFKKVESIVSPAAILTTDTSSISIRQMAGKLKHPERFCGFHFFHPVPLINLIEIIRHDGLSDDVVLSLSRLSSELNRNYIVVKDAPGSVVNAILTYYYMEALYILEEGLMLPSSLDETARKICYIGPCESMDVIGIDFMIEAMTNCLKADTIYPIKTSVQFDGCGSFEETHFHIPYLLTKLPTLKRFGRKTSSGLYRYEKEIPIDEDSDFYIDPRLPVVPVDDANQAVMERLLYSIFHGVLFSVYHHMASADHLDMGIRETLQMKTGPMSMMKNLGPEKLKDQFTWLAERFGRRFNIPDPLIELIR